MMGRRAVIGFLVRLEAGAWIERSAVVFVAASVAVGCGSSGGGGAAGAPGGGGAAGAASGGASGALAASGASGASGSDGAAGSSPAIAPYATHIAGNDSENFAVIKDGRVYRWASGVTSYDASVSFAQVSASGQDACFIAADSTISCLGQTASIHQNIPKGSFTAIRVGADAAGARACAKSTNGTLTCWGDASNPIVTAAPSDPVTAFDVSPSNACAVTAGNAIQCWGSLVPNIPAPTGFSSVYTNAFACGVAASGEMTCWASTTSTMPNVAQLSIGEQFACGIETNGHAFCFDPQHSSTVPTPPDGSYVEIMVAGSRACGVLNDGSVTCWGESPTDTLAEPPPDAIRVF